MIYDIKTENELRKLAGLPLKEAEGGSLDNIIAKHREAFESVMRGESMLFDHDEFYDELYEHYVSSGEMPYGVAKARDGDPDQWIQEELDREYGDDFATDDGEPMDGDFDSGMASAGMGTDEDYGYYGESKEVEKIGSGGDPELLKNSLENKKMTFKDHLKEAGMEIRNIPASDKAKRSLYMPSDYFKHLGNKDKEIGWKQNRDLGQGSSLDSDYKYKQKPMLIDPETGDHVPIGSADLANTKRVAGSKKIKLKTPYGTQTQKDTEQHAYNPHVKDTWRRDVRGKRVKIPGAFSTDKSEISYDYGKHGMFDKQIAAAKAKRAQQKQATAGTGIQTTSTSFGKSSDINKPNVITKKIGN